jgi:hypothetical protein
VSAGLRELQTTLLEALGERLKAHGFSTRAKSQSFERKFDGGRAIVHLGFIAHATDFDVTADVAVRFDAVEELVNRSNQLLSKKEKSETATLGAELGNLERGQQMRWTVQTEPDVPAAAAAIYEALQRTGLPYLERYTDLDRAYEALASDDRAAWLHSPFHTSRAQRACAMLVLLKRSNELAALVERKIAFLQSAKDPLLPQFQKFVTDLQAH